MEAGSVVRLDAFGGSIERRVVEVRGDVVLVCCDTEYAEARRRGRAPVSVGFPVSDVLANES